MGTIAVLGVRRRGEEKKWVHDGYGLTIKAVSVGLYSENPLWQTWKEDRWRALR